MHDSKKERGIAKRAVIAKRARHSVLKSCLALFLRFNRKKVLFAEIGIAIREDTW